MVTTNSVRSTAHQSDVSDLSELSATIVCTLTNKTAFIYTEQVSLGLAGLGGRCSQEGRVW